MSIKREDLENCSKSVRDAFKELDAVLPVVQRVHGGTHPELEKVDWLVGALQAGLSEGIDRSELNGILDRLREVTGGYTAPSDACGGFQKEYRLLSPIDAGIRTKIAHM